MVGRLVFSTKNNILKRVKEMKNLIDEAKNYLQSQTQKEQLSETVTKTYVGEDTWVACVSYIPFVAPVVLLLRKNNSEFVSIHAKQSLVILLFSIVVMILLPVVLKIVAAIMIYLILVFGAFQAIRGRKWYLPIVTEIAHTFDL